ncbi:hypothetical protein ANN_26815 [Periplaneta americana]|uniref:PiggyBac transposable element-derived protein domain-containing protein n=1 Tax=Periplaneta americana TaxID=6978 RepID=A0ABQ8RZ36_PERAM|nr:hypothetical protein ANN_26815 [Periplaneta americana]
MNMSGNESECEDSRNLYEIDESTNYVKIKGGRGGGRGRNCSQVTNNSDLGSVETAPDGTQWTIISPQAAPGRRARQNIVTDAPRLTGYAKRSIINGNHSSTVKLLIDDSMLLNIKSFTENRACQELQDDSLLSIDKYMNSKPNKFGIKFWLAVDTSSKYLVNGFPYLGRDEEHPASVSLAEHVVMSLEEP